MEVSCLCTAHRSGTDPDLMDQELIQIMMMQAECWCGCAAALLQQWWQMLLCGWGEVSHAVQQLHGSIDNNPGCWGSSCSNRLCHLVLDYDCDSCTSWGGDLSA